MKSRLDDTRFFETMDLILHWGVAALLIMVALAVFVQTIWFGITALDHDFMGTILRVVNDLLFVIIILEVLSTVTSHFHTRDFALKPFLIVGTISVVRHILIVGARMSMLIDENEVAFTRHLIELAVNGVVTLVLVLAYFLVNRADKEHTS